MTKEQFEAFKEGHYYPGADPPAFLKGLMEDKEEKDKKEIIEENKEKIENGANQGKNKIDLENGLSNVNKDRDNGNNKMELDLKKAQSSNLNLNKTNSNNELKLNFKAKSEAFNLRPRPNSKIPGNDNLSLKKNSSFMKSINLGNDRKSLAEEKLSIIPDNEDYKFFYSKEEYGIRKQFWEIMFKDWIEQQREKEEKEGKEKKLNIKTQRNRSKKMIVKPGAIQKTPFEAIKSSNKFGKKINYSYIKSIMSKRK